jgi:hypothetical protein
MIRSAVNDEANSGEVAVLHEDVNRVEQGLVDLMARVEALERQGHSWTAVREWDAGPLCISCSSADAGRLTIDLCLCGHDRCVLKTILPRIPRSARRRWALGVSTNS